MAEELARRIKEGAITSDAVIKVMLEAGAHRAPRLRCVLPLANYA
jgi:hypothetical protein